MTRTIAIAALTVALTGAAGAAGLQAGAPGFPGTPITEMVTPNAPCAAVQTLVDRRNHAFLTFAAGNWLVGYGSARVVKDQRYCLHGEDVTPIWVPTRDAAACFAGYTCETGGDGRGRRR